MVGIQSVLDVGGIRINAFPDMQSAVREVIDYEGNVKSGFGVAINPEKLVLANESSDVANTIQKASIRFSDGIGIVFAIRLKYGVKLDRIPGCELWECLMKEAGGRGVPVALIGAKDTVLRDTVRLLKERFGTNVVYSRDGYFESGEVSPLVMRLQQSGARIVAVAMGSPKQEHFILRCREEYPDAFYIGVGGTFDVFTGHVSRAPKWACNLGLEWFYRLILNPSRAFRQIRLLKFLNLLVARRL